MVRESKKSAILEAAARVLEADGITGVTFDTIAAASGITRGGIIYHFRSREELLAAIHQHLARRWEQQLEATLGKPVDRATPHERLTAYIRTSATSATRAELQMIIDSRNTQYQRWWDDVLDRWTGRAGLDGVASTRLATLALLAADGLWMNEILGTHPVPPEQRRQTAEHIISLIQPRSSRASR